MKKPRPGKRNGYQPPLNKCSQCGKRKRIFKKIKGKLICREHYQAPKHKCAGCGKIKVINYNDPKLGPLCYDCYKKPKHRCSICGQIAVIAKRNQKKLICHKCYIPPFKECRFCHRERPLATKNPPTCNTCYCRMRNNNHNDSRTRRF
ncbi:MAG: hypothetical protein A2Y67_03535 [Candidatus Buchananbacteria bacterium RBG_13_39_9]|uniref:Uncharacterized protein n=1 Tax=Candidatus Buchananbacteria bacterium RBG_13_39_9 TaxID=1797531 RepID=A0A1G1XSI1_9BACT|nr:MAG: hypothetical protein A2Y67_03535 [Candidatus Buchananbacteria bacterium RBG_13_39_9]